MPLPSDDGVLMIGEGVSPRLRRASPRLGSRESGRGVVVLGTGLDPFDRPPPLLETAVIHDRNSLIA